MRAHPAGPRHGEVIVAPGSPPRPESVAELHNLDPAVWPASARRVGGCIAVGGVSVASLAAAYETPLFVLDEQDFRDRARAYTDAYAECDVYYASKAFLSTRVAQWAHEEGLGIDVASGGELAVALRGGVPANDILFHGNNKSAAEIERAINAGVGRIVLDSLEEIERVAAAASARGIVQPVFVRITVGVEAHTHEFIATAHEDQKFGLSIASGAAEEAVRRILQLPSLRLLGVHSHIGSQIFDAAGFEVAAARAIALLAKLSAELGFVAEELNLGGGMGIAYVSEDDPLQVIDMADQIRAVVSQACAVSGIPVPRLAVEPGRSIVGPAGITVYEVGTVKPVDIGNGHVRTYVSVDGGMSDNIRTALYDAEYTVLLASRESSAPAMLARVVGKHCESGDVVIRDAWLPSDLVPGDLLAVAATGAYCRSMSSQYNYIPRPAVVSTRAGESAIVLRRETEEDLLSLDPGVTQGVSA